MSVCPTNRLLLLFVLLFTATQFTSAQTFFGTASSVADGASAAGTTAAIIPPASMQAGDLVIVYVHYRTTGGAITVSTTGGQTWNVGTANDGGAVQRYAIAWCRFNGTWGANPVVTGANSAGIALTAVMYVFRPTNPNNSWAVHVTQANSNSNAASNTINSVTTTFPNTVTMAFWSNAATNTWSGLAGAGWSKTGLPNQIRNVQGADQAHTAAYQIMAAAGATGTVTQNQTAGVTVYRSSMSWHETPENNDCAGAFPVTVNLDASCTVTTNGTTIGATQTTGGCTGTADDDVWFRFTATSASQTISATPAGATPISNIVMEVFNACGGASFGCVNTTNTAGATESTTLGGLTVGATYYYRLYSSGNSVGVRGTFTTCVTVPTPSTVATGKSFINITRPNGGTVIPGDELEIRVSVNVSGGNDTRIFRTRYNDTLPTNLNFVPGSMRILTNESKVYKSFTDAAGDDGGYYHAATRTVRFNLGRDTTGNPVGTLSSTGIDSSLGGGYFNPQTHFPRGNGVLMIVTYRVIVDASVPYNTIFNYGPGAFRYRNQLTAPAALDYVLAPNPLTFIVYPNFGLCSNATGLNYITAGNGDFGSGVAHNGIIAGTVPDYNYVSVTTGNPGDGNYSVTKNLSPSQNTDPFVIRPQSPTVDRVFGVWDIIGDHTGAADPIAGNPPSASGANGGYMLAVNAAYQLSVANTQVITGLCEDTYYEFSAWFRNVCKRCGMDSAGNGASGVTVNAAYIPTAPGDSSGVKPNLTFQIDGVDYYNSGNIDYMGEWGEWVQKGFVFRTAPGQTSLTVSIKNNAPGGGGNDWVMDDISLVTCLPSLEMRPSNSPAYCNNGQVDVSVAVSTFYDNYAYYQWERSTDNGVTWSPAPELPAIQSYSYTSSGGNFLDTVALPSFLASSAVNGFRYRIRTSTSLTNITSDACAIYNSTDVIQLTVNPSCDVLPAQLLHFNVQLKEGKASLLWKVKQEGSLSHYLVERSTDGQHFTSIGSVAARGASALEEQYLFTDPALTTGIVYYRLKLVTSEGASKYSNILSVSSSKQQQFAINNLVNPFAGKIAFQLEIDQNGPVDLQLLDALGRPIVQKKVLANKGVNAVSIDVPAYLQKGSYLLRVVSEAGIVNRVIQKQ